MLLRNLCVRVLWTKVISALKGLSRVSQSGYEIRVNAIKEIPRELSLIFKNPFCFLTLGSNGIQDYIQKISLEI